MNYLGTTVSDAISVTEIFTVLRPDLSKSHPGRGEAHYFPEIIYLSRGQHTLLIDGTEYTLTEGQMIIYAPNAYHMSLLRPKLAEAFILTFEARSEFLPSLYNRVITLNANQRRNLTSIIEEGVGYFCGRDPSEGIAGMMLKSGLDSSMLWGLKKRIELFLIDVYKTETEATQSRSKELRWNEEFTYAVEFLQAHLTDSLTLSQIAEGCSMSISKLKLLFRQKAHMGPINYWNELRIEEAKRLIRKSDLNVTQISEQLGFASIHYFSRLFKKVAGVSPTEYANNK